MKLVEFLIVFIIFPRISQLKFFVTSQKVKNIAKNISRNNPQRMEDIQNSIETFSECLSMDEFKNYDIFRTVQLCFSLSTIEKDSAENSISVPLQRGKRFLLPRKDLNQCDSVCQKRSIPVRFHDIKKVVARGARVKTNQIRI